MSFLVYLCKNQFKLGSPKLKVVKNILPTAARRSDAETKQEITLLARSLSHCFIWESLVWLFVIGLRFQFLNLVAFTEIHSGLDVTVLTYYRVRLGPFAHKHQSESQTPKQQSLAEREFYCRAAEQGHGRWAQVCLRELRWNTESTQKLRATQQWLVGINNKAGEGFSYACVYHINK